MSTSVDLAETLARIEARLAAVDTKVDAIQQSWRKSMEWLGQMGEHVQSLDAFREEVRASLEPLFHKLDNVDDVMHIMRHATADVARRIDALEGKRRLAG